MIKVKGVNKYGCWGGGDVNSCWLVLTKKLKRRLIKEGTQQEQALCLKDMEVNYLLFFFTLKRYYTFCSDWRASMHFVRWHINVWKAYCCLSPRFLISTAHIQQAACLFVLTKTLIYQATRIKHVKYPRFVIRTVPTSFRADHCALITSHIAGMFQEP